ncbi:unnamed protein product [Orchesella dallaii]|uniref:Integrase catalytic domain-containing protein n=1 Tax=Orchesella dallaii TaxID=48710 RepID=A0ABP1RN83_9HEXA
MDRLKSSRRTARQRSTRMVNMITAALQEDEPDMTEIRANLEYLSEVQILLDELDVKIADMLLDDGAAEDVQDREEEEASSYKLKYLTVKKKVEKVDNASSPTPSVYNSAVSEDTRQRTCKLPKIELRKFTGELRDWLGFWSYFQSIDEDESLNATDKFHYLQQAMVVNTEAYELVSGYPHTAANYPKAVEALKRRYGNEDLLLQVYIRELLTLVISNVNAKEKIPLEQLYLKLESHLRALKSLNLEEADPASWLFPLVESSLPDDILLAFQRSQFSSRDGNEKSRLELMMEFLNQEVEIRQKINLAKNAFQENTRTNIDSNSNQKSNKKTTPTLAGFHVGESRSCVFCGKGHNSQECFAAQGWPLAKKKAHLKEGKRCYQCFGDKHMSKNCKFHVKCCVCALKHYTIMCPELDDKKAKDSSRTEEKEVAVDGMTEAFAGMSSHVCSSRVALNTLMITLVNGTKTKTVRAFIDSGSQRTYILQKTAQELELEPLSKEVVTHTVFGGGQTPAVTQTKFNVILKRLGGNYSCEVTVRDQVKICGGIARISRKRRELFQQLKENHIYVTDVGEDCPPIELLIGADLYGRLLTGNIITLDSGITAIETKLGWTLCGEFQGQFEEKHPITIAMSLSVNELSVTQLWDLDVIGIRDTTDVKTEEERAQEAKLELFKSIARTEDGRYAVALPWKEGHPPLPSNREVALKRLHNAVKKLNSNGMLSLYGKIFRDWEDEKFIERVTKVNSGKIHYLPHRPVLKPESLTTPVRPVFDASCFVGKHPSLNQCLEKGANYVQLIPDVLLRFREKQVGFISDIRKAFQMVEVKIEDRDCMRFLWFENGDSRQLVEYRHTRVMFGATCSPFILGAVLEYHLTQVCDDKSTAMKLLDSLYVDNCVASVDTVEEYEEFKRKSIHMLEDAKMELRMWMSNKDVEDSSIIVPVLGLNWDRREDTLSVDIPKYNIDKGITKRVVLSVIHSIFDPIGFTVPALIPMKKILQQAWIQKMKWDDPLPEENAAEFEKWCSEMPILEKIKIPRISTAGVSDQSKWSLHVFCDASKDAYAAVVYIRAEKENDVSVQLLAAKSRVTPVKVLGIPRLELLGCLVGARLAAAVKKAMKLDGVQEFYWTDSSTALTWIHRDDSWATFVGNRVAEINRLTKGEDWRHVPGTSNPADLPSRGCSPSKLVLSEWWEGPSWLLLDEEKWPKSTQDIDEVVVAAEKRKTAIVPVTAMHAQEWVNNSNSYSRNVRVMALVMKFCDKVRKKPTSTGVPRLDELKRAETQLIKQIQTEAFPEPEKIKGIQVIADEFGILRVRTRIVYREDLVDFKYPVVLPRKHQLVEKLIMEMHRNYCHAGVGFLLCRLREHYWILQARRAVKNVISKCYRCRRYAARAPVTEMAPLPENRIKDVDVFQIVGVDLAGPLHLKNGNKCWIVIYTCAVYRAVQLDVVTSLSTKAFIRSLKEFVWKHGRPEIMYSDNGTNFRGANNMFAGLDWNAIQREEQVSRINWRFNPPSAAWWGGWWERLIRSVKDMLRRMLGKATITKTELQNLLLTVEEVMNGRPLTYLSENAEELQPLTPSMFMRTSTSFKFPELEATEGDKLRMRYKCVTTLKDELKQRFRREYLSQLVNKPKGKPTRPLQVGEIVIVENENRKRMDWPLGRILELIPGKDGVQRVAKVKTQDGVLIRPVQRLFPMEVDQQDESERPLVKVLKTRSGREVKVPIRFNNNV